MKFQVRLIETYSAVYEIEAENADEAFEKADQMVSEGEIDAVKDVTNGDFNYEREIYVK
jgi:hypothetical protein